MENGYFQNSVNSEKKNWLFPVASTLFLITTAYIWQYPVTPHLGDERMGAFVSVGVVLTIMSVLRKTKKTMDVLAFLGTHSANIYLLHTFYNGYWNFTWLHNNIVMRSGLNFLVLLAMSLVTSIVLEFLKEKIGVNKLAYAIKQKLT